MTPKEALKELHKFVTLKTTQRPAFLDVCEEALAKQIPKKPIIRRYYQGAHAMLPDLDDAECPNCGARSVGMDEYEWKFGFCINCGQKILWEDDEE